MEKEPEWEDQLSPPRQMELYTLGGQYLAFMLYVIIHSQCVPQPLVNSLLTPLKTHFSKVIIVPKKTIQ